MKKIVITICVFIVGFVNWTYSQTSDNSKPHSFTALSKSASGNNGLNKQQRIEMPIPEIELKHYDINTLSQERPSNGKLGYLKDCDPSPGLAESCTNSINVDQSYIERRGVVKIVKTDGNCCTGSLINTTANDGRAYILLARHSLTESPDNWKFYFNYEKRDGIWQCVDGGADVLASSPEYEASRIRDEFTSDFALIKLRKPIPADFKPYFNGWSRENKLPSSGFVIHHPEGDIKKMAVTNSIIRSVKTINADTCIVYHDGECQKGFENTKNIPDINGTWWYVHQWEKGVTQGGSSGSPLFDQNHRIIGQLCGGDQQHDLCSTFRSFTVSGTDTIFYKGDTYGKLWASWDRVGQTKDSRLSDWLDPIGSGATYVDGYDPTSCVENINLTTPITTGYTNFIASVSINASNVISNNANVHYGAPSVNLLPGFNVSSGSVFVADTYGCHSTSTLALVKGGRSEDELEQSNDKVSKLLFNNNIFPNPTHGEFTVRMDLPEHQTSEIRVYDGMGKLVKSVVASATETLVTIEDQPAGIYFVRYTVDGKDQSAKVVKL